MEMRKYYKRMTTEILLISTCREQLKQYFFKFYNFKSLYEKRIMLKINYLNMRGNIKNTK